MFLPLRPRRSERTWAGRPACYKGGVPNALDAARGLDDLALIERTAAVASRARAATTELVAAVAELEARDLHLKQGYSSLFGYCREALALSEHDAYRAVAGARVVRRFPLALELLAQGSINLTSVGLLAPCLTADNHRRVLEAARGKRRTQVEELVAQLVPQPDAPPAIQRLLSPAPAPLSSERYRVQVTMSRDAVEKLRLARDMLRHALSPGDDAAVLERALTALLADLAKKKFAAADQPRPPHGPVAGSRHVPAEVKREVWLRDLGRCAFVGASGHRCGERGFLEFHHVQPYAAGGAASVENIQLRCRRHNAYEARQYFGAGLPREPASDDRPS